MTAGEKSVGWWWGGRNDFKGSETTEHKGAMKGKKDKRVVGGKGRCEKRGVKSHVYRIS